MQHCEHKPVQHTTHSSVSAVNAVRQHCEHKPVQHTTHGSVSAVRQHCEHKPVQHTKHSSVSAVRQHCEHKPVQHTKHSSVIAVRQHCEQKPVQNTTHSYMPCVSLKVQQTANCMQHSASGEAKSSTASQQIRNLKVYCSVHISPPYVHILNTTNTNKFNISSIYLTSILILFSHQCLLLSTSLLPSCCPPKIYNLYSKHVSCSQLLFNRIKCKIMQCDICTAVQTVIRL